MDEIKADAECLYLLGDLFDFWFEYKNVIPRGFIRFQGKLAEFRNTGIPVIIFRGNHDMWMFDYFEKELDIPVIGEPIMRKIKNHVFYLGHGDGLGPGDHSYKLLKKVFANKFCQWLFARLHPNFAFGLAKFWSGKSRHAHSEDVQVGKMEEEWLYQFANQLSKEKNIDYFIFGHRHIPIDQILENNKSRYINLGDWMSHFSYAVYDGDHIELKKFNPDK